MINNAANILVFDSGVGGLSVVAELRKLMPDVHITYVADDEFRPYGDKSEAQLKARLPELLKTLVTMTEPDVVVIACNTASTTALSEIRAALDIPVIGVVPAIKPAAEQTKTKSIAVLGTPGTVKGDYVDDLIAGFASDCAVTLVGSSGLVDMAERKLAGAQIDIDALRNEISLVFERAPNSAPNRPKVDVVVLACTHFPLLVAELERAAPYKVAWIDSGAAIAQRTQLLLEPAGFLNNKEQSNTAFLIGPETRAARRNTFATFGFDRVVSLKP